MSYSLHAAIARLAAAQLVCEGHWAPVAKVATGMIFDKKTISHSELCCGGSGYTEPFKALQVECELVDEGYHMTTLVERIGFHKGEGCLGWQPEPDVERACWRVWKEMVILGADVVVWVGRAALEVGIIQNWTREEAVLRAAEAWLEGK